MIPEEFKFKKEGEISVRLAPSTTGLLHIGTARAALFNYLFARKNKGVFIVRIEDTDKERSKKEFEENIIESLKWLWIEPDEGPVVSGNYGPYRQSERKKIYEKYLKKLLKEDNAYYCFCPPEELKNHKEYQLSIGEPPRYTGKCAHLPEELIGQNLAEKKPFVIRFRIPPKKVEFEDLIRGKIEFDASLMGDMVIAKDFFSPLYNFACVVDDYEMEISHVVRGEDHIPNTPKQILIQEALGLPQPKYAHLPLILGPDRSKLSKRHGAVSVSDYKKQGYLPEAIVNFMALLGWNPGTEREIYSINSLVKEFSLERVQKSGAVFNIKRLDFLNGFYIRQKSIEKLTELCLPYLIEQGLINPSFGEKQYPPAYGGKEIIQKYASETGEGISLAKSQQIVAIYQERLKKLSEIAELTDFFFKDKVGHDKDLLKWKEMSDKDVKASLNISNKILYKIKEGEFNEKKLSEVLLEEAVSFGKKMGKAHLPAEDLAKAGGRGYLLWPLRVALTGKKESASPFEVAEILGKEKTLKRIKEAIELT